jgi:hypothetical protein
VRGGAAYVSLCLKVSCSSCSKPHAKLVAYVLYLDIVGARVVRGGGGGAAELRVAERGEGEMHLD